jgi:adenylosuccinate lyase
MVYDSRFARPSLARIVPMTLKALAPTDGRYADKVHSLRDILSEYGLIRFRVLVEVRWLQFMAAEAAIAELAPLSSATNNTLQKLVEDFSSAEAGRVKEFEATTNHDVKAVEYLIREKISAGDVTGNIAEFVHFACTSEDINNLAYGLMLKSARDSVLVPRMTDLQDKLQDLADEYADLSMLSRTHGQAASPTTLGKEVANVGARLRRAQEQFSRVEIRGKFNGAVGNFNAHVAAYPEIDWPAMSARFVISLGLDANPMTTQIEPHDWTAEYCHALIRYNTILLDLCRDIWSYISIGYFSQQVAQDEVGSSTMPHKVNPIDFENAEGNLGLATAMLEHFATKLPISRWQRDLTDSTVQRNFGVAIGYVLVALQSVQKGLGKIRANEHCIGDDIDERWEVLGEAVQTVMRRYQIPEPYEKLKALTRGRPVTRELLQEFIQTLEIPDDARQRLLEMTPAGYTGLAGTLARARTD